MLYKWSGDQKRGPIAREERATCRGCGGFLAATMSVERGMGRGG